MEPRHHRRIAFGAPERDAAVNGLGRLSLSCQPSGASMHANRRTRYDTQRVSCALYYKSNVSFAFRRLTHHSRTKDCMALDLVKIACCHGDDSPIVRGLTNRNCSIQGHDRSRALPLGLDKLKLLQGHGL